MKIYSGFKKGTPNLIAYDVVVTYQTKVTVLALNEEQAKNVAALSLPEELEKDLTYSMYKPNCVVEVRSKPKDTLKISTFEWND